MTYRPFAATALVWLSLALVLPASVLAGPADLQFQAQVLWAGDDGVKPPEGKNFKPVEAAIAKKLKDLPLKWNTYYEASRTNFSVALSSVRIVSVSSKCQLEVSAKKDSALEVTLRREGKDVFKRNQPLPEGEILVLGGNASKDTAWLVVLRRAPRGK
jgi:hypothetical protein